MAATFIAAHTKGSTETAPLLDIKELLQLTYDNI